jgi:hypothetical protein
MLVTLFIMSILPGVDFFGHFGSLISGGLIGLAINCLKIELLIEIPFIKKIAVISRIAFLIYTVLLFSIFLL